MLNTLSLELSSLDATIHPDLQMMLGVADLPRSESRQRARGWKIEACCRVARSREIGCVCVDTCCIDKSRHAEFSGAMNSMFAGHQDAVEVFRTSEAHPSDV